MYYYLKYLTFRECDFDNVCCPLVPIYIVPNASAPMSKDNRLSFRISQHLSARVDRAIDRSAGQIRDRSEFGTKATKFYLDYIENIKSEDEVMLEAILALAGKIGERSAEISDIKTYLEEKTMIPNLLSSYKEPNTHPDFSRLLNLYEMYDEGEDKKLLSSTIQDATYDDIGEIYKEWTDLYFSSGKKVLN